MNEPLSTTPNLDLVALTKIVGTQLRDELERKARMGGIAEPGFLLLMWVNDKAGVKFISNRVESEYTAALEVLAKHLGMVTWRIGRGAKR